MNQNNPSDIRCVLLCKSFQSKDSFFDEVCTTLNKTIKGNVTHYITLGEFDSIFTFKLDNMHNVFQEITKCNETLSKSMIESFYKPLYLVFPKNSEKPDRIIEDFWQSNCAFFFVSTIHTNNCCIDFNYKEKERKNLNKIILDKINNKNYSLKYLIYHSLDLSEYVILWKTNDPASVLSVMEYLYESNCVVGYTNTICAIPRDIDNTEAIENINFEEERFDVTIQAVANSYQEALAVHNRVLSKMEKTYNVDSYPHFCFGNYDYLCTFDKVTPQAFFDLHNAIYKDLEFKRAILSMNAVLSKESYKNRPQSVKKENNFIISLSPEESRIKTDLTETCKKIKKEFFNFFVENEEILDGFHWRKPLSDLLILLETMSKSTVFDAVCFLFLDNAHFFLYYLKHLKNNCLFSGNFKAEIVSNGIQIDKFIREWEQLAEYVVRIDGTFQRTPGYESLNHNVSSCIVEYHNAYTQCLIDYFSSFDAIYNNNKMKLASFVVPKMCRHFKTSQWFCANGKKDSMLYITIPMHELYSPFITMTSLTHEISHYCPNSLRLREERINSLIYCTSILICDQLGIGCLEVKKECFNILLELLSCVECSNIDMFFLENLSSQLKNSIFCMIDNTETFQRLHDAYCSKTELDDIESIKLGIKMRRLSSKLLYNNNLKPNSIANINTQVDDIVHFFKEGYADIMMIYLLSLTPNEYFRAVFADLSLLDFPKDDGKLRMKFQRAIIVCEAIVSIGIWNRADCNAFELSGEEKNNELLCLFKKEYTEWLTKNVNEKYFAFYYSKEILLNIIEYLTACLNKIKNLECKYALSEKRNIIKNYFNDMVSNSGDGLFSESFHSLLKENRENILNRWHNRDVNPFVFE